MQSLLLRGCTFWPCTHTGATFLHVVTGHPRGGRRLRKRYAIFTMMDFDTPSCVSSQKGEILPSPSLNPPPPHDFSSSHAYAPSYQKHLREGEGVSLCAKLFVFCIVVLNPPTLNNIIIPSGNERERRRLDHHHHHHHHDDGDGVVTLSLEFSPGSGRA